MARLNVTQKAVLIGVLIVLSGVACLLLLIPSVILNELRLVAGFTTERPEAAEARLRQLGAVVERDPKSLSVSIKLSGVRIYDNCLIHLRFISRIERLSIRGADITDNGLNNLSSQPGLQHLVISNTYITDACLKKIKHMKDLRSLDLSANPGITDASMDYLKDMKSIKTIDLSGTNITMAGLADIRKKLNGANIMYK